MESLNGGNGLGRRRANGTAGAPSLSVHAPIGEIVDTSVADFAAQACELNHAPPFGGFVKVTVPERTVLRGRDGMRDRAIFEQNPDLEHLLRTEFSALIVGYSEDGALRTYLPPSPPPLHWSVVECDPAEVAALTMRLDYLRTILAANEAPVDALLAANVRQAGAAHLDEATFRLRAGRELATLLKHDYPRLTAILRALVD